MLAIRGHYRTVEAGLALARIPVGKRAAQHPIVIVPIARLDEPARQAIAFANSISPEATAVHVTNDADAADDLRANWAEWAGGAELVVIESPYRALIGPLLAYLDVIQRQDPSGPVLVVLSEFVPSHWWENLLHNQTALRLKLRLFTRPNTIVADVPYRLRRQPPASSSVSPGRSADRSATRRDRPPRAPIPAGRDRCALWPSGSVPPRQRAAARPRPPPPHRATGRAGP